jgi:hypothetical protein
MTTTLQPAPFQARSTSVDSRDDEAGARRLLIVPGLDQSQFLDDDSMISADIFRARLRRRTSRDSALVLNLKDYRYYTSSVMNPTC